MDAVLCGSPLNPLSAVAAAAVYREMSLRLVVVPEHGQNLRDRLREGRIHALSLVAVACFRLLHCLLRKTRLKRSDDYTCLREFLIDHPHIPIVSWDGKERSLARAIESLGIPGEDRPGVLVSCIFPYRLPTRLRGFEYLVNIHPGLLPQNRGPAPHFWSLTNGWEESGLAFHRLAPDWDAGEVLCQRRFRIHPGQSEYGVEKIAQDSLQQSLTHVLRNLPSLWEEAVPQGHGTYHRKPTKEERVAARRRSVIRWWDLRGFWSR